MVNLFFFFFFWGGGGFSSLGMPSLAPKCTGFDCYKMQYIYQVENLAMI